MSSTRRRFLIQFAALAAVPAAAGGLGCADDAGSGTGGGSGGGSGAGGGSGSGGGSGGGSPFVPPDGGVCAEVGYSMDGTHDHAIDIEIEDVYAGTGMTFTLSGGGHTHTIDLTAGQLATLAGGGAVEVESSEGTNGPHTHTVMISCIG